MGLGATGADHDALSLEAPAWGRRSDLFRQLFAVLTLRLLPRFRVFSFFRFFSLAAHVLPTGIGSSSSSSSSLQRGRTFQRGHRPGAPQTEAPSWAGDTAHYSVDLFTTPPFWHARTQGQAAVCTHRVGCCFLSGWSRKTAGTTQALSKSFARGFSWAVQALSS